MVYTYSCGWVAVCVRACVRACVRVYVLGSVGVHALRIVSPDKILCCKNTSFYKVCLSLSAFPSFQPLPAWRFLPSPPNAVWPLRAVCGRCAHRDPVRPGLRLPGHGLHAAHTRIWVHPPTRLVPRGPGDLEDAPRQLWSALGLPDNAAALCRLAIRASAAGEEWNPTRRIVQRSRKVL